MLLGNCVDAGAPPYESQARLALEQPLKVQGLVLCSPMYASIDIPKLRGIFSALSSVSKVANQPLLLVLILHEADAVALVAVAVTNL